MLDIKAVGKSGGGASSNEMGCNLPPPLIGIGLTYLPKKYLLRGKDVPPVPMALDIHSTIMTSGILPSTIH